MSWEVLMSKISSRGIAAVEIIYLLLFFLGVAVVVQHFSLMSSASHREGVDLQNSVEAMMIQNGRPSCLEAIATNKWMESRIVGTKRLIYVDQPICVE